MAFLDYTASNGQALSIVLPNEPDFTARLIIYAPMTVEAEKKFRETLGALDPAPLACDGDHFVFAERALSYFVLLIRPPKPSALSGALPQAATPDEDDTVPIAAKLLLHRTRREWIVVAEEWTQFAVDQVSVPLIKIIREGAKISVANVTLTFREIERIKADHAILQTLRRSCPFCGDAFQPEEQVVQCPSCGTLQHSECWDANQNRCCGPAGCAYGRRENIKSSSGGTAP